jgi:hypothetical protein
VRPQVPAAQAHAVSLFGRSFRASVGRCSRYSATRGPTRRSRGRPRSCASGFPPFGRPPLTSTLGLLNMPLNLARSANYMRSFLLPFCAAVLACVASTSSFATSPDGQYFLPGEFVAYVSFLFLPPLAICFVAQAWVFVSRGVPHPFFGVRALASFAVSALGSLGLAAVLFASHSQALAPVLRVRELSLAGAAWPVSPLAFLAVAVVAPATIWWGSRRARS